MKLLGKFNVKTIELGAQSMDDEVLKKAGRGHTALDIAIAAGLIKKSGFSLGLQMMIGLPGDTLQKAKLTAHKIINLGAANTRIYPALVIRGTKLEEQYLTGRYQPLTLEEAVKWSKELLKIFEDAGITVLRLGLHPSEGLLSGQDLVAGPFHPSFRELVLTEIWNDKFITLLHKQGEKIEITVSPDQLNYAIGYESKNKKRLHVNFKNVVFRTNPLLKKQQIDIKIDSI